MATFSVHFDGPITVDHRVPLRVLSKTYEHMQRAIDRAYLLEHRGQVWKHARLSGDEYEESEFLAAYPREGGIILDAFREGGEALVDTVYRAVRPLFERALERGVQQNEAIGAQLAERRQYAIRMGGRTPLFQSLIDQPRVEWADAYSARSIVKEVAQLVQMVVPERLDGSTISLDLVGSRPYDSLVFDRARAQRFHLTVSRREVAQAYLLEAKILILSSGTRSTGPSAKILNFSSGREVVLHLHSENDFFALHPYHTSEMVRLYVAPMMEAGGFDVHGGDLYFLAVAE